MHPKNVIITSIQVSASFEQQHFVVSNTKPLSHFKFIFSFWWTYFYCNRSSYNENTNPNQGWNQSIINWHAPSFGRNVSDCMYSIGTWLVPWDDFYKCRHSIQRPKRTTECENREKASNCSMNKWSMIGKCCRQKKSCKNKTLCSRCIILFGNKTLFNVICVPQKYATKVY